MEAAAGPSRQVEPYVPLPPMSLFGEYNDPALFSFIGLFFGLHDYPLAIWDKQTRGDGKIFRAPDEEDSVNSLYLSALVNPELTYITTPRQPYTTLGIRLNYLTFVVMSLRRRLTITVQVTDKHGLRRRIIFDNNLFQILRNSETTAYVPIHFEGAWCWNHFQFNLSQLTATLFHSEFVELTRIQVSASCRIRLIYSSTLPLHINTAVQFLHTILAIIKQDAARKNPKDVGPYLLIPTIPPVSAPPNDNLSNGSSEVNDAVVVRHRGRERTRRPKGQKRSSPSIPLSQLSIFSLALSPSPIPDRNVKSKSVRPPSRRPSYSHRRFSWER